MRRLWTLIAPPALLTAAAFYAGTLKGLAGGEMARGLPAIFAVLCGVFFLGDPSVVHWVASRCDSRRKALAAAQILWLPYLLYALPLGAFSPAAFLRLVLYVNLPLLVLVGQKRGALPTWRDALAVLLVWLPIEFGLLGPIWPWPPGQPGNFLNGLVGACLAVFLFVILRGLSGVGYTFAIRRSDLAVAFACFLTFASLAIPFGLATGFLHLARRLPSLLPAAGGILGIFLLTGVPEELLFRGVIQNLLQRWIPRRAVSLVLAALVFGAAHLNNGPQPDWRYFVLAIMAGIAYGFAYRLGGTLVAPTLTHTMVDSAWTLFFHG